MYTDKLFTGQRDTGLGIYYYGARFYSQKLGRFLSADTIVPGAGNPQAWNRYSYTLNNPLRYTDPTGHSQCQTQEDCEDMGTTPMGTGSTSNSPGNKPPKPKPHPHDDDDPDPNPTGYMQPPVCSSIMCAPNAWGFPTYNNPQPPQYGSSAAWIAVGVVLITVGVIALGSGVTLGMFAVGELVAGEVVGDLALATLADGIVGSITWGSLGVVSLNFGGQAIDESKKYQP